MNQAKLVMNNQVARDFTSLAKETQQLALAVCGQVDSSLDNHLVHLAENLQTSELLVWAARQVIVSEAIGVNWEHLFDDMVENCLREFHEESYIHLRRMHRLMASQLVLSLHKKLSQIDDFGIKAFRRMKHYLLNEDDQSHLKWASSYHDVCRMCYSREFWETPGPFSPEQRKQLDFHARNFYFLGEMYNVNPVVSALSVLHHWPNKGYPDNGIIAKLSPFLRDPKFRYMLNWLVTTDVYCGSTDRRSYRDNVWDHIRVLKKTLPDELGKIGMGFVPFIHALWKPNQQAVCLA